MKDINSFTKTFEIISKAVTKAKQRAVIGLGGQKIVLAELCLTIYF